jgi:anti-anti-sigma factor
VTSPSTRASVGTVRVSLPCGSAPAAALGGEGGTADVVLRGEIDMSKVHACRLLLEAAVASRPAVVRVDMAEVQFIDADGLGALIGLAKRLRATRARLLITRARPGLRRAIDVVGLAALADVEEPSWEKRPDPVPAHPVPLAQRLAPSPAPGRADS